MKLQCDSDITFIFDVIVLLLKTWFNVFPLIESEPNTKILLKMSFLFLLKIWGGVDFMVKKYVSGKTPSLEILFFGFWYTLNSVSSVKFLSEKEY